MIMSFEKGHNFPQTHYVERTSSVLTANQRFDEDLGTDFTGNVLIDVTEFAKKLPSEWFFKIGKLSFSQFIEFVMHWTCNTGEEATFFRDNYQCSCQNTGEHRISQCPCYKHNDDLHHIHLQSLNRYIDFISFFRDNLPLPFDSAYGQCNNPRYALLDLKWPDRGDRLRENHDFDKLFQRLKKSKKPEATRNAEIFRAWVTEHVPESQALVNAIEEYKREHSDFERTRPPGLQLSENSASQRSRSEA